jgi:hypothetical protein
VLIADRCGQVGLKLHEIATILLEDWEDLREKRVDEDAVVAGVVSGLTPVTWVDDWKLLTIPATDMLA